VYLVWKMIKGGNHGTCKEFSSVVECIICEKYKISCYNWKWPCWHVTCLCAWNEKFIYVL